MRSVRALPIALVCALQCSGWSARPAHADEPTSDEIADMIGELGSSDAHVREVAHRELVRLGGAPAEALAATVRRAAWNLQREALSVLADIGPAARAVAPELVELAYSQDAATCCAVVRVVARVDPAAARPIVAHIVELALGADQDVAVDALQTLAALGPEAEEAISPLVERLPTLAPELRPALAKTLLATGFDAIDHLLELWTTDHDTVAAWAPAVLRANPERAVVAARHRLGSEVRGVRIAAVTALGAMTEAAAEAVPDLGRALDDPVGAVRRSAAESLARVGAPALGALPALTEAVADPRGRVQLESAVAIGTIALAAARSDDPPVHAPGTVERAVADGLAWIVRHQSADGGWDCDRFTARCTASPCAGPGRRDHDVGVTGLALRCLVGAGETPYAGPHRDAVASAVGYLLRAQDGEGCFGPRTGAYYQYDSMSAALAIAEWCECVQSPQAKAAAERAVNFVALCQNPYAAWRYGIRDGDNDTSVTGWAVSVLATAAKGGVDAPPGCFHGALNWLERVTDPESGRVGYQRRGGPPARSGSTMERFPPDRSESLTAVGLVVRLLAGRTVRNDPALRRGVQLLAASPPRWDTDAGTIDLYYWLYGTRAMRLVGGTSWASWRKSLVEALVGSQERSSTCAYGSWPTADPWSAAGGRVWTTTAAVLCLEQCLESRPDVRTPMSKELQAAAAALSAATTSDDSALRVAAATALDQLHGAYR